MERGLERLHKYVQEGIIYRGLEGLQVTSRGLYIIVGIDCGV